MMASVDMIVVGSGGAGLSAALTAAAEGLDVLVLEKQPVVGGSTAVSGGMLWIPCNPLMARAGDVDTADAALNYFEAVVGDVGPASSLARRRAFIDAGPDFVSFLEREGLSFVRHEGRSDYYDERPGGNVSGRSIEAKLFNINALGAADKARFRMGRSLPVSGRDARHLFLVGRTFLGKVAAARMAARMLSQRWMGKAWLGVGGALIGRLFQAALLRGVTVRTNCAVLDLVVEKGSVRGVKYFCDGEEQVVLARRGVVLASGGFARNFTLRREHQPDVQDYHTHGSPGETGEMILAAARIGAATALMDHAIWIPAALPPGGPAMPLVQELAKPFSIIVDQSGQRFCNEAGSHVETAQKMIERNRSTPGVPSWVIMDARHRRFYPWGMTPPGRTPKQWFESGYFRRGNSIRELAENCGIDPAGLEATVKAFNGYAASGKDPKFARGSRSYDRYFGDPRVSPNPSLGAIERGPFFGVAIYPADVGTLGGLITDEHARVLRADGSVIEGLYAAGNTTAPVLGRVYTGAGASISAACVFGHIAARHIAGSAIPAHSNAEFCAA